MSLSAARIEAALTTTRLGRPVHHHECVGSTNEIARQLAREGAAEGTLILAEEQSYGRGRLGRTWWAPRGSCLLFSLILRPPLQAAEVHRLTMAAGLAAAEAVETVTTLRPQLKWPNDLQVRGRKAGGMLTELESEGQALLFAIVGTGLNVNVDFEREGPEELRGTAIGLAEALGRSVDRLSLLVVVLQRLEARYEQILQGHSPHEDWGERLVTLGRWVRVSSLTTGLGAAGDVIEGVAVGVDADGALLVRTAEGSTKRVVAGDVTVREPDSHGR